MSYSLLLTFICILLSFDIHKCALRTRPFDRLILWAVTLIDGTGRAAKDREGFEITQPGRGPFR